MGFTVGRGVTTGVGAAVGFAVGRGVTTGVGAAVGFAVGRGVTTGVGAAVGFAVGRGVTTGVGAAVAASVRNTWSSETVVFPAWSSDITLKWYVVPGSRPVMSWTWDEYWKLVSFFVVEPKSLVGPNST